MSYKIYMPKPICDEGIEILKGKNFSFIGVGEGSDDDIRKYTPEADVILCRVHWFPDEVLATAKKLKLFQVHGVGYQDHIVCNDAAKRGIYVAYTPYGNINSVAEGAMALILSLTRYICEHNTKARTGEAKAKMNLELDGATLGLLAIGNIARNLAHKAHYGFNMKVMGYVRNMDYGKYPSYIKLVDNLDEVFANADVVSLHIPGEPEYKDMINKKHFDLMKPTAYFINTARDILVNNADLYDALKSGKIAGAAADVEYLKTEQLLELNNFINTPHSQAFSDASLVRSGLNCAREIIRVMLEGKEPRYWVNKENFVKSK